MDERKVLVVVEDPTTERRLLQFLSDRGYPFLLGTSLGQESEPFDQEFRFTIVDLDGEAAESDLLVRRLRMQCADTGPVIALTHARRANGLSLTVPGVNCVVSKAEMSRELDHAIQVVMGIEGNGLTPEPGTGNGQKDQIDDAWGRMPREMGLWQSPRMREVREIIREAAGVDVTVLITGETGTGKDVAARAIHALSARRSNPFVKVNCAAVPRELLESELFGHERGAFTGAHKLRIGKFEAAHRGTIFLDEIGDLHPALQAKLLHVLQDGDFSRVGGKSTLKVDVRVLAATNQDLERGVAEGRFREDLYYRLNVIQVFVPPLRERVEEIPALVEHFIQVYSKAFRREPFAVSPPIMDKLLRHRYPGNVRELENLIKRMIVLGDPFLTRHSALVANGGLPPAAPLKPAAPEVSLKEVSRKASLAAEREVIARVLQETGGNRVRAAKALRISYRALLYKIKRVGLRSEALSRSTTWSAGDSKGFSV